ncbi:metallophosphoesterase [bacterium]|nr:metallophosphoesterase [bacterium]
MNHLPRPHHPPAHRAASVGGRLAQAIGRNWARVGYARRIEPTWLEVNRFSLPVRGLSAGFEGLKIAHLTDFHYGAHIPKGYLEDALDRTAAEKPDVVALTGDFIDRGPKHLAGAAKLFCRLKAPLGVFAVLGNHDFSVHTARGVRRHPELHRRVADALGGQGVRVLRNESVRFDRPGGGLVVAGVDDLWSLESNPVAALAGSCPNTPRLVLAHNPCSAEHFAGHRFDLMLSGHTHGGQIDWPGLGRLMLSKKAKRWAAGMYPHEGGQVYVNKGVGFGWRFRFGVRPEVALFTLRATGTGA